MPSTSIAMRRLMGLAEHHPSEVNPENRGVLKMSRKQLHDFASTSEKGLPYKKPSVSKIYGKRGKKN